MNHKNMSANIGCDQEAENYFSNLPTYIQETMLQSGISFCTKAELEEYTKQLTGSK